MKNDVLVIGSRASKLALAQAALVRSSLEKTFPGLKARIEAIRTSGDKISAGPLNKIGNKGLFTKEIERALLREEVDIAVHSMKDLPAQIPAGLRIAAITKRADPRDALVSNWAFNLKDLPQKSRVGTSSSRRRAQLLNIRRDLQILELRGNLDTRIKKLENKMFDAIVVAVAGIKRLGVRTQLSYLPVDSFLPAAGQGALGIEIRQDDQRSGKLVKALNDFDTELCVQAERVLLSVLGAGCHLPLGVYARREGEQMVIKAGIFSLDGRKAIRDEIRGNKKETLGLAKELAQGLRQKGKINKIIF